MTEFKALPVFPIDQVRAQFPAYALTPSSCPVYLDNPAGTLVPKMVIDAVSRAMATATHNLGGAFAGSDRAVQICDNAHQSMALVLGAKSEREVIIAQSMTCLTLHISRSIGRLFKPGDEIIVTKMDHEGNISPWLLLAEDLGLTVKWLPVNKETWRIEPADLEPLITDRTRLLALNYSSNVSGSINDVKALTKVAKKSDVLVYVDAVQLVPHRLPEVYDLGCDFLACSSYKFFGPHLGVLWGREEVLAKLQPYKARTASNALPECFETGTPQTELLAGLTAAVDYLAWLGEINGYHGTKKEKLEGAYRSFQVYEDLLMHKLINGLQSIDGVKIFGISEPAQYKNRVPTVSFYHNKVTSSAISKALGERNIYSWSGHNYARELIRHFGINEEDGIVRLGIAHYNDMGDIEAVLSAINDILKKSEQ